MQLHHLSWTGTLMCLYCFVKLIINNTYDKCYKWMFKLKKKNAWMNKNVKYKPVALYWLGLPNRLRNFLLWEAAALPSTSEAAADKTFGCLQTLATTSLLLLISSSLLLLKSSSFLFLVSSSSRIFFSSSSFLPKCEKNRRITLKTRRLYKHTPRTGLSRPSRPLLEEKQFFF